MTKSHPNVVTRPPFLYAGGLILAALVKSWREPRIFFDDVVRMVALVLAVAGMALFVACLVAFKRHRTTVSTHRTPSALIEDGPYRYSRNPIYVALTLVYLAVTFWTHNLWGLVFLVPVLVIMQKGVIEREEAYLTSWFGEAYAEYRSRVRRWL